MTYLFIAIGVSFFCSIAEAVLLSVTPGHISLMQKKGQKSAELLTKIKEDINVPLAAILSLNTIAHTVGAAGTGAQAAHVFGEGYLGVISGVLTLLILVFSEIIPKTLGAMYWRKLAPITAYSLRYLIIAFYPFVKLSALLTRRMGEGPTLKGFSREEFAAMAELSTIEGQLGKEELRIMQSMLKMHELAIQKILTPRSVVFSVPAATTVDEFFRDLDKERFSRIPIYDENPEHLIGFVLRSDLFLAQARNQGDKCVKEFKRELHAMHEGFTVLVAFERFLENRYQIAQVVDEHGGFEGILTLEDIVETAIGFEIVDESDTTTDMQNLARRQMRMRLAKIKGKK